MTKEKPLVAIALAATLLVMSGCSVINPHVTWDRPKVEPGQTITLQQGLDYADHAIKEYKDAIGHQAILTSIVGVSVISLGLATLGLGITEAGTKAVTILGLTTAGTYGTGTWLSSKPRQLVYAAGIEAMTCAKEAMAPLDLPKSTIDTFTQSVNALPGKTSAVESNISKVSFILRSAKGELTQYQVDAATEMVRTAREQLELANGARISGNQLKREFDRAGSLLMAAVDRIGAQIDVALVKTEPNISALPDILSDLTKTYTRLGKLPESPKAAAPVRDAPSDMPKGDAATQLGSALGTLSTSVESLSGDVYVVSALVNSLSESTPTKALKSCKVDTDVTGIQVQPPGDVTFEEEQISTQSLVVMGGKPSYFAHLLQSPVPGLDVQSKPTAGIALIEIVKSGKTLPGIYHAFITDTAGNSKAVFIKVKPKQQADVGVTVGAGLTPTYTWPGGDARTLTVTRLSDDVIVWQITVTTSPQGGLSSPVTHGSLPPSGAHQVSNAPSTLTANVDYKVTVLRKDNKSGSATFRPQ